MVQIEITDDQISPALARLVAHLSDLTPFYGQAGEIVLELYQAAFQ